MVKRDTARFALTARRRLVEELAALPIFSVPRSSALLNYLAVLEVESLMSARSPLSVFGAHRQAVESSAHAIPAIFERCPKDDSLPAEAVAEKVFNLAHDLFTFTHRYDQIDYSYRLAERGHWAISVAQKDPRITFSYASPEADQADTLARAREIQAKISHDQPSINVKAATETFMKLRAALAARTRPVQPESCEYVIDDDVLSVMRDLAAAISQSMDIGMDADVKVGAFTFGEFRAFWSALLSVIETHTMAHDLASVGGITQYPIRTSVLRKQKSEMTGLIASVAGISPHAADFILRCYVYDPRVSGKGPISQPFLPIAEDNVCVSSLLVPFADFERNFFRLLHRSPLLLPFASSVDSQKEPISLRRLATLFAGTDYATKDCVQVPGTDIDLLAYEHRTGFTLIIQHKWLTAPETPEDSSSNDENLRKGIVQGFTARDYLRSNPKFLKEVLKLPPNALISRIECATVCHGLEGSSFMEPSDVPVVAEQAFMGLFTQASGLEKLWGMLLTRPDKTFAAEQAFDGSMTIRLAEYEFVMPALGF
ncbi:MAG: hypothetical protein WAM79_22260 [Candidatus Sulfotelmatobacter sp.]